MDETGHTHNTKHIHILALNREEEVRKEEREEEKGREGRRAVHQSRGSGSLSSICHLGNSSRS
jgi:hypothetical protein